MENYGAPMAQPTVDRQVGRFPADDAKCGFYVRPGARVLKKIPVNKGVGATGGTGIPVFPIFPLGRPRRPFFFATFGGKSGAKSTHHISGGGESRKT